MIEEIKKNLENSNIKLNPGMTEDEIEKAEKYYNITFPKDLRDLLLNFLPVGESFYNWNDYSEDNTKKIKKMIEDPICGIIYDIENNNFWMDIFGKCPDKIEDRVNKFIEYKDKGFIPKLIPIYSHRYVVSDRDINYPIISVYQTDIIYYGINILDYFEREFDKNKKWTDKDYIEINRIQFWSDIIEK